MKEFLRPKKTEVSVSYDYENKINDLSPNLKLLEKNADVSYDLGASSYQKNIDIYIDDRENRWFEIKKSPRKQMTVSLLSQPFFNISIVIEKQGIIHKFFSKINPQLAKKINQAISSLGGSTIRFFSKGLDTSKIQPKENYEALGEFLAFNAIFEDGRGDRDYNKEHNIIRTSKTYALFDFDDCELPIYSDFTTDKKTPWEVGTLSERIRKMLYAQLWRQFELPFPIIETMVSKLNEMKDFYNNDEAVKFITAVLKKTEYEEELPIEKVDKKADPVEIQKGILSQIGAVSKQILLEMQQHKDVYISKDNISSNDSQQEYQKTISTLEQIVKFTQNELGIPL